MPVTRMGGGGDQEQVHDQLAADGSERVLRPNRRTFYKSFFNARLSEPSGVQPVERAGDGTRHLALLMLI